VAAELSLVAGGSFRAAERCPPAKAGAQSGEVVGALRASGPLPSHGHWRLPQPKQSTLSEVFIASPRDGGWAGFLLPQVDPAKPLLWVQDRMAILETGRVHPAGLGPLELIHIEARDARDALWAMEEGLRCPALSAVIGEIWGDPAVLDFTATRRLAVAAERRQVPCWLVRMNGMANLSGARMRWRIASRPSLPHPFDFKAPGVPAWDAELFRARGQAPGRWSVAHETTGFHRLAEPGDRALAEDQRRRA
jgi:protein ImuA